MQMLSLLLVASTLGFSQFVAAQPLEEAPFITSPDNVTLEMLRSAGAKRGDHMIDLVSRDKAQRDPEPAAPHRERTAEPFPGRSALFFHRVSR